MNSSQSPTPSRRNRGGRGRGDALLRGPAGRPLIALCAAAALSASCGLDTYGTFVSPPDSPSVPADGTDSFEFGHGAGANSGVNFRGYEVLYRIYQSKADADADTAQIGAFIGLPGAYDSLKGSLYNYRAMKTSDVTSTSAFIPIDSSLSGQTFTITLDFSNVINTDAEAVLANQNPLGSFPIFRDVSASSPAIEGFRPISIQNDDPDVKNTAAPDDPASWVLVAYAFSEALDSDAIQTVHSTGVYLGWVNISK